MVCTLLHLLGFGADLSSQYVSRLFHCLPWWSSEATLTTTGKYVIFWDLALIWIESFIFEGLSVSFSSQKLSVGDCNKPEWWRINVGSALVLLGITHYLGQCLLGKVMPYCVTRTNVLTLSHKQSSHRQSIAKQNKTLNIFHCMHPVSLGIYYQKHFNRCR